MSSIETRRQQILDQLHAAAVRLTQAQLERTWAIISAHEQGLSLRQIATATGLSSTRVHQLLSTHDAQQIPHSMSQLWEQDEASTVASANTRENADSLSANWLETEANTLRQCVGWLEQLERRKPAGVGARLETDSTTEFETSDGAQIRHVLSRIAADLESRARSGSTSVGKYRGRR